MRRKPLLMSILCLVIMGATAQVDLQVSEEIKKMSLGEKPGYIVDIPGADYQTVEKAWTKFLEEGTKLKVQSIGNELIIKGAVFKKVTLDSLNVYSSVYKIDTNIRVIAFFELDSVFIRSGEGSPHQKEIAASLQSAVRDFAVNQYIEAYDQRIEAEENTLKDLEKERESLTREIEKHQKTIKGNEENIRRSEDATAIIDSDLELNATEIGNKKLEIASLRSQDPEMHKMAEKELKSIEKDKKKLGKQREKEKKNIVGYQRNISEAERSISHLEKEVEALEEKIADQKDRIDRLEAEKNRIR